MHFSESPAYLNPHLDPHSSGYVAAITACARGEQWAMSLDFLSEALQIGWNPNGWEWHHRAKQRHHVPYSLVNLYIAIYPVVI